MRHLTTVLAFALSFGLLITGCESELTGPEDQRSEALSQDMFQKGAADKASLAHELNAVRKATKKYRDVQQARDDGYVIVSEYVPGMGFHFINPVLFASDATEEVDITKPPILVYFTTGNYDTEPGDEHDPLRDGDLILGAVEYAHLGDDGPPGTPGDYFSDEDASRNTKVSEDHGWHWTPGPDFTALHAWVHRGNPDGVFHPSNPTIDPQTETEEH